MLSITSDLPSDRSVNKPSLIRLYLANLLAAYSAPLLFHLKLEDGGQALILDDLGGTEFMGDGCLFVRVQSWDEAECKHPLMNDLVGKKIRITIEVED